VGVTHNRTLKIASILLIVWSYIPCSYSHFDTYLKMQVENIML
jgi:hypothetical protein